MGIGAMYVTKPYKFIWFGDIHGPKPYKFKELRWALISQTPVLRTGGTTLVQFVFGIRARRPYTRRVERVIHIHIRVTCRVARPPTYQHSSRWCPRWCEGPVVVL